MVLNPLLTSVWW